MPAWIRVEAAIDEHPKLSHVGWPAVHVWVYLLRVVKLHGRRGVVSVGYWNSTWIAERTGFTKQDVQRVLDGLLADDGPGLRPLTSLINDDVHILKWGDYQVDAGAAERMRRHRANTANVTVTDRNTRNVTPVTTTGQDRTGQVQGRDLPHEEDLSIKKTSNTESLSDRQDIEVDQDQIDALADGPRAICEAWPGYPPMLAEQTWLVMQHELPRDYREKIDLLEVVAEARRAWAQKYDQQRIHTWLRRQVQFAVAGLKRKESDGCDWRDEDLPYCRVAPGMKWLPHQQTGTARDAIRRMREQYPGESPPEKVAEWTAWYEERGGLEGNGNG